MKALLELWSKLDQDTIKLFMAFAAKAIGSGDPNRFIKDALTKIVVDPMPERHKDSKGTVDTTGEVR
jgi:hypothetical protein